MLYTTGAPRLRRQGKIVSIITKEKPKFLTPVEVLLGIAGEDMVHVDAIIRERMRNPVGMIPNLAEHLVGAGGKRLRPLITVACANMCGYKGTDHHKLAAAVEFIHSATLLHDDVVDASDKRRGEKTANLIWGNAPSILVGDFLFARAFSLMVEAGSMAALDVLSRAACVIAEGEVRQLSSIRDLEMAEAGYMQIIGAKTAALFAAAAEVGGILSRRPGDQKSALHRYGKELGLAFQIVDDALDYGGLETALGKSVGDDFREGKMTLPVILAYRAAKSDADTGALSFWKRVIRENEQQDVDLEQAIFYLRQSGAIRATLEKARVHGEAAIGALAGFPKNQWKTALSDLADFVVTRGS